jgi:biopolymer transport protein ExbD/biopolymer transport protein TolR
VPSIQPASAPTQGRGRGRRVSSSLAEINVVPLVDVMLVLLIIFMVTAPMLQRGIDIKLPVARRANVIEGERLFVTVPSTFKADGHVYVNSDRVRAEVMEERVRQKMETTSEKQVYLRGDETVQLQELMTIISRLKDAGVVNVAIVAKAPGEI